MPSKYKIGDKFVARKTRTFIGGQTIKKGENYTITDIEIRYMSPYHRASERFYLVEVKGFDFIKWFQTAWLSKAFPTLKNNFYSLKEFRKLKLEEINGN